MNLDELIDPIREMIKNYVWGGADDWKRKLDIVRELPSMPQVLLRPRFRRNRDTRIILTDPMNTTCCERCGDDIAWWRCTCYTCAGFPDNFDLRQY